MANGKDLQRVFVVGSYVQACCWYVARLPEAGESVLATGFRVDAGGKGLNVAVGLARLGCEVSLLVGCGDDPAGDELLALLEREGMAATDVIRLPAHSGIGSGHVGPAGENQIVVFPGANALVNAAHVLAAAARMDRAHVVYAQFEAAPDAIREAFRIASHAGVTTVLNPSPWREPGAELRATTQVLIVNRLEAEALLCDLQEDPGELLAQLGGDRWPSVLKRLTSHWPGLLQLQVTLGEQGGLGFARASIRDDWTALVCEQSSCKAVDSVGAGDAFSAAYVAAIAQGLGVPRAMRNAHRCAAHMVGGAGVLARLADGHALAAWAAANDLPAVRGVPSA